MDQQEKQHLLARNQDLEQEIRQLRAEKHEIEMAMRDQTEKLHKSHEREQKAKQAFLHLIQNVALCFDDPPEVVEAKSLMKELFQ